MSDLAKLKKIYDKLGNDSLRSKLLASAELLGVRKDILRMDTNNYCNIRCIMCNRLSTSREKHFMSLGDFTTILDCFAPGLRNLYLSCACEPLATPHFAEYLVYARSLKIPFISFCTNALALNREIIETAVDTGIDEIILSANGFTPADYNRIMAGSDYDIVTRNLWLLNDYKKKKQSAKPHLRLNTVLMKSNLTNPDALINFVRENTIETVQFRELQLFIEQNDPEQVKAELLGNVPAAEYQKLLQNLRKMTFVLRSHRYKNLPSDNNKSGGTGIEVILPLAIYNQPAGRSPQSSAAPSAMEKHSNPDKHTCSVPFFSYWIDWEGNVRVCGYDKKAIIGNVLQEDMNHLLAQRKKFRKLALCGECSSELCTMNIDTSALL